MNRRILGAAAAATLMVISPLMAKDKSEETKKDGKDSGLIATVNGEPVTKKEWSEIWKADQWHGETLKKHAGFTEQMQGKPYEDYFFKEEVVKIKAMEHKYKDSLPQMKAAIDAIYEKAKAGEDFAELAKQYSQDPGSAAEGGDLGEPKELHEMVFPFNRIALKLKEGEISEPLLTIFGYHILKVDRILPASEGKGKRVAVRNILIRFPSPNPRAEAEELAESANIEILDKKLCKKLVSYCPEG